MLRALVFTGLLAVAPVAAIHSIPAAAQGATQKCEDNAQKKARQKKRRKTAKRAGITAAALVAVFGVSMTSDANRRYVLEVLNTLSGKVGMRIGINYLEGKTIRVGDTDEEKAQDAIKQELNVEPVKLGYLPEGWKFFSYEINAKAGCAILLYSNGESWINISIKKTEDHIENVTYYQFDGEAENIKKIINDQGIRINLYENEEKGYTAEFTFDKNYYNINTRMDYEELNKILKYIVI